MLFFPKQKKKDKMGGSALIGLLFWKW